VTSFDAQAALFDARAGVPGELCAPIAGVVLSLAALREPELLVEVGAGTGALGVELARRYAHYVALDASEPMLEIFRERLAPLGVSAPLHTCDADGSWPIAKDSAAAVFGSRVLHLLDPQHFVAELQRVSTSSGLRLLEGRVERSSGSARTELRKKMHELLGTRAESPPNAKGAALRRALEAVGAVSHGSHVAARWSVDTTPRAALDSWRSHDRLAGRKRAASERERVLAELETWAAQAFGSLDLPSRSEEQYVLEVWHVPSTSGTGR
jgi:SAM-dependent methyltransferase